MSEPQTKLGNPNEDYFFFDIRDQFLAYSFLDPEALSPWPISWEDPKLNMEEVEAQTQASPSPAKPKSITSKKYKVSWSKEEDEMLYKSYMEFGMNWKKISEVIKTKSSYLVKKRFYDIIYEGDSTQGSESSGSGAKRKANVCESLTEKQKLQKIKQLYSRMMSLQKFISDTKDKLYNYAEKSFPINN
jgi:hypothetical protein